MAVTSLSRGTLSVLACPPALCPHAEFAVAGALAQPVALTWTPQSAHPGVLRAGLAWQGRAGSGNLLAGALRRVGPLCFDVVEAATPGCDAERFSFVPDLGMHRVTLAAHGDAMIGEEELRAIVCGAASVAEVAHRLDRMLGGAWDAALEPLRRAADGHPVGVLRHTG